MSFYLYRQNKVRGLPFDRNQFVDVKVVIEAPSEAAAGRKLDKVCRLGHSSNDYCPCCGSRWTTYDVERCDTLQEAVQSGDYDETWVYRWRQPINPVRPE